MSVRILLLVAAGVIAVVSIPLILKVMPRTSRYGLRTPLTLSSDELWFRANYFAGWASVIAAAVSATLLIVIPGSAVPDVSYEIIIFSVPIIVAVVVCLGYVRYLGRGVAVDNQ